MMECMEILLHAWGQEQINPSIEVSIRSPLGQVDARGGGIGGHRCLSTVETWVAQSRAVVAVQQVLLDLAETDSAGRVLYQLAQVRYARRPALPVADQRRLLGISERTYRRRVGELHLQVAARLPAVVEQLMRLESGTQAAQARERWLAKVAKVSKRAGRRAAA